jgi:hypothetical protein
MFRDAGWNTGHRDAVVALIRQNQWGGCAFSGRCRRGHYETKPERGFGNRSARRGTARFRNTGR